MFGLDPNKTKHGGSKENDEEWDKVLVRAFWGITDMTGCVSHPVHSNAVNQQLHYRKIMTEKEGVEREVNRLRWCLVERERLMLGMRDSFDPLLFTHAVINLHPKLQRWIQNCISGVQLRITIIRNETSKTDQSEL